jgi:hypothetical protein
LKSLCIDPFFYWWRKLFFFWVGFLTYTGHIAQDRQ